MQPRDSVKRVMNIRIASDNFSRKKKLFTIQLT
jgi:hypothetical protein